MKLECVLKTQSLNLSNKMKDDVIVTERLATYTFKNQLRKIYRVEYLPVKHLSLQI